MKNLLNKILMKFNYKLINITKTTEYINKYTKELEEQIINLKTTHLTEVKRFKQSLKIAREVHKGDADEFNISFAEDDNKDLLEEVRALKKLITEKNCEINELNQQIIDYKTNVNKFLYGESSCDIDEDDHWDLMKK